MVGVSLMVKTRCKRLAQIRSVNRWRSFKRKTEVWVYFPQVLKLIMVEQWNFQSIIKTDWTFSFKYIFEETFFNFFTRVYIIFSSYFLISLLWLYWVIYNMTFKLFRIWTCQTFIVLINFIYQMVGGCWK